MLGLILGLVLATGMEAPVRVADAQQPLQAGQAPAPDRTGSDAATPPAPEPPPRVYRAPRTGQPRGRIAGITRSAGEQLPRPLALAPDHVAQTVHARPRLYWSIDRPWSGRVVFTLSSRDAIEPECELELPAPARAGAQSIDLEACPADVAPGTEYEWFVALVADSQRRARDVVAQGWIRRIEVPAGLDPPRASPAELAGRGLWYDALDRAADQRDGEVWNSLMGELSISSVPLP
jgi:hypothetical protein